MGGRKLFFKQHQSACTSSEVPPGSVQIDYFPLGSARQEHIHNCSLSNIILPLLRKGHRFCIDLGVQDLRIYAGLPWPELILAFLVIA